MARQSGASEYFVARKGMKVYLTNPIHVQVRSITTQHDQDLYLSGEDAAKMKGKKVLIVDDVISTGESRTRWKNWSIRRAARSPDAWQFLPRATRRSGRILYIWKNFPPSTPTEP